MKRRISLKVPPQDKRLQEAIIERLVSEHGFDKETAVLFAVQLAQNAPQVLVRRAVMHLIENGDVQREGDLLILFDTPKKKKKK